MTRVYSPAGHASAGSAATGRSAEPATGRSAEPGTGSLDRGRLLAALPQVAQGEAVFLPADPPRLGRIAFWTPGGEPPDLGVEPEELTVVRPHGPSVRRTGVRAVAVPVERAMPLLTRCRALGADGSGRASAATAFWGAAATLGLSLLARGRVLPGVSAEGFDAWRVGPFETADLERLRGLAAAMPPEARAVPVAGSSPLTLPAAEPLLRAFLDAVADSLTRTPASRHVTGGAAFADRAPQAVPEQRAWAAEVAAGRDAGLQVSLRLELPGAADSAGGWWASEGRDAGPDDGAEEEPDDHAADATAAAPDSFRAVVQLRSLADPTVLADAADLWAGSAVAPEVFGPRARVDTLLTLRRAARVWPPAARLLETPAPIALELSDGEALALLGDAAESLAGAGVAVHWPKELVRGLTASGVLEPARRSTTSSAASFLSSGGLLDFRWRVALGDRELTAEELERLVLAHRPLVRLRDQWVVVDPELVRRLRRAGTSGAPSLTAIDALGAALTGSVEVDGERVAVTAGGVLEELRARIADPEARAAREPQGPPKDLAATLRDYQLRGLNWLHRMTSLGLGGCLADVVPTNTVSHISRVSQANLCGGMMIRGRRRRGVTLSVAETLHEAVEITALSAVTTAAGAPSWRPVAPRAPCVSIPEAVVAGGGHATTACWPPVTRLISFSAVDRAMRGRTPSPVAECRGRRCGGAVRQG